MVVVFYIEQGWCTKDWPLLCRHVHDWPAADRRGGGYIPCRTQGAGQQTTVRHTQGKRSYFSNSNSVCKKGHNFTLLRYPNPKSHVDCVKVKILNALPQYDIQNSIYFHSFMCKLYWPENVILVDQNCLSTTGNWIIIMSYLTNWHCFRT